jgi:hypothetical protein
MVTHDPKWRRSARWLVGRLKTLPLRMRTVESRFADIYRREAWRGSESASGPGSSLLATAGIREALPLFLNNLGCRALVDVPCGDFHWLSTVPLGLDSYVGADIVLELVTANAARYASPERRFLHCDMRHDPLPRADLILCRDGLVHLSDRDLFDTLANFRRSGATYLLATHFTTQQSNPPIATGQWRPLNLELAPFRFPPPLHSLLDWAEVNGPYADKSLALWRLADLP